MASNTPVALSATLFEELKKRFYLNEGYTFEYTFGSESTPAGTLPLHATLALLVNSLGLSPYKATMASPFLTFFVAGLLQNPFSCLWTPAAMNPM